MPITTGSVNPFNPDVYGDGSPPLRLAAEGGFFLANLRFTYAECCLPSDVAPSLWYV